MNVVLKIIGVGAVVAAAGCSGSSGPGGGSGGNPTTGPGPVQHPTALVGTVGSKSSGDSFSISLTDPQGKTITNLAAGSYKLTVHDFATIHNFHLTGGGVNDATPVGSTTTKTFTVNFTPGTYTFICDSHPTTMKGTFTVS